MIVVHYLNNSRAQRILWMLEELELDYEVKFYERDPRTMMVPAQLRRVHPLGKSPVVEDSGPGGRVLLVETGAICEYLVERTGQLGPQAGQTQLYRQFLHYGEGSVMPLLFTMAVMRKVPLIGKLAARRLLPMLEVHLDFIEDELGIREWFAGRAITAADIVMSFPLEAIDQTLGLGDRPGIRAWLGRVRARPAYQRALNRAGAQNYSYSGRPAGRAQD